MTEQLVINKSSSKEELYKSLIPQISSIISDENNYIANLANISSMLNTAFDSFSWVGFYLTEDDTLVLGPFQGEIACTRIAFGKGVCGVSAKEMRAIIVPDVNLFKGHIACSSKTNSELVVPLINNGLTELVLDLDSEKLNNFDATDKKYIRQIIELIKKKHFSE